MHKPITFNFQIKPSFKNGVGRSEYPYIDMEAGDKAYVMSHDMQQKQLGEIIEDPTTENTGWPKAKVTSLHDSLIHVTVDAVKRQKKCPSEKKPDFSNISR